MDKDTEFKIWRTKTNSKLESFDREFTRVHGGMQGIRMDLKKMKSNDLVHIQAAIDNIKEDTQTNTSNIKWILAIGAFLIAESTGVLIKLFFT